MQGGDEAGGSASLDGSAHSSGHGHVHWRHNHMHGGEGGSASLDGSAHSSGQGHMHGLLGHLPESQGGSASLAHSSGHGHMHGLRGHMHGGGGGSSSEDRSAHSSGHGHMHGLLGHKHGGEGGSASVDGSAAHSSGHGGHGIVHGVHLKNHFGHRADQPSSGVSGPGTATWQPRDARPYAAPDEHREVLEQWGVLKAPSETAPPAPSPMPKADVPLMEDPGWTAQLAARSATQAANAPAADGTPPGGAPAMAKRPGDSVTVVRHHSSEAA